jgi:hypothetical protein
VNLHLVPAIEHRFPLAINAFAAPAHAPLAVGKSGGTGRHMMRARFQEPAAPSHLVENTRLYKCGDDGMLLG